MGISLPLLLLLLCVPILEGLLLPPVYRAAYTPRNPATVSGVVLRDDMMFIYNEEHIESVAMPAIAYTSASSMPGGTVSVVMYLDMNDNKKMYSVGRDAMNVIALSEWEAPSSGIVRRKGSIAIVSSNVLNCPDFVQLPNWPGYFYLCCDASFTVVHYPTNQVHTFDSGLTKCTHITSDGIGIVYATDASAGVVWDTRKDPWRPDRAQGFGITKTSLLSPTSRGLLQYGVSGSSYQLVAFQRPLLSGTAVGETAVARVPAATSTHAYLLNPGSSIVDLFTISADGLLTRVAGMQSGGSWGRLASTLDVKKVEVLGEYYVCLTPTQVLVFNVEELPDTNAPPTPAPPTAVPTPSPPTPAPPTVAPTVAPTSSPPTAVPTVAPTSIPSTASPTVVPTSIPLTSSPTVTPTSSPPTAAPTPVPSTASPTVAPTLVPLTASPTDAPTLVPTSTPSTAAPTVVPASFPPTAVPTSIPLTDSPTVAPTLSPPTAAPTSIPSTASPTGAPTLAPTSTPLTASPTVAPTLSPSTTAPTVAPTSVPLTAAPTLASTSIPLTDSPTVAPTLSPPTTEPTVAPTSVPFTAPPTVVPISTPLTDSPTAAPTPTLIPLTAAPTSIPVTDSPTLAPTSVPLTEAPTAAPPVVPTSVPLSAVPTSSPLTASPTVAPTPVPLTDAPTVAPTLSPPTAAPTVEPTSVPPTSSPTVVPPPRLVTPLPPQPALTSTPTIPVQSPYPATPGPLTHIPETLHPATAAPPAAAPPTPTPKALPTSAAPTVGVTLTQKKLQDAEKATELAGEAAAVSSLAGAGAAAGPATRGVVAGKLCKVGERADAAEYPRILHPTQWDLLGSQAAGMVIGNFTITGAFWLLMVILVKVLSKTQIIPTLDTLGMCRFPSAPLFVFQFFLQGTSLGAMALVLHAPSPETFILGVASLVVCLVVPFMVLYKMAADVPAKAYFTEDERVADRKWLRLLIGPGEWVSVHEQEHWVMRYATILRPFSQQWACFSFVEMSSSLAIAAVDATTADTLVGCGHKKLFSGFVFALLLVIELMTRPRVRVRDIYLLTCVLLIQALAMVMMATGYYLEDLDHWTFNMASTLMLAAVGLLLVKTALDLISEAYIICTKRRQRLQQNAFHAQKMQHISLDALSVDTPSDLHSSVGQCAAPLHETTSDQMPSLSYVGDVSSLSLPLPPASARRYSQTASGLTSSQRTASIRGRGVRTGHRSSVVTSRLPPQRDRRAGYASSDDDLFGNDMMRNAPRQLPPSRVLENSQPRWVMSWQEAPATTSPAIIAL